MEDQLENLSETLNQEEWGRTLALMDDCLQDYLRDAVRIFPLKVYACDFYRETADDKPYKTVYFTGRFELGHCSVYKKLKAVNRILNSSNIDQLQHSEKLFEAEYFKDQASGGGFENACEVFNDDQNRAFLIKVQVKRMDHLGKEYSTDITSQSKPSTAKH